MEGRENSFPSPARYHWTIKNKAAGFSPASRRLSLSCPDVRGCRGQSRGAEREMGGRCVDGGVGDPGQG